MAGKPRYTIEQMVKALTESRGLVSIAARKLGCEQQTIRNYANRHPQVQQAMTDQRDVFVDNTELRLIEAVEVLKQPWAIALVLKTLGKNRGYVERTEQSGPDGGPIQHAHAVDLERLSDDELDALEAIALRLTGHPGSPGKA